MQDPRLFIGVDVAKDELVISTWPSQGSESVPNNASSISAWLKHLPIGTRVAMESTGRYHRLLAHLAAQAGLTVFVLNARDVYFYARAVGSRAKTDAVDAVLIARYLAEHHAQLHPWQAPAALLQQLQDLLTRRVQLVTNRSSLTQSLQGIDELTDHLKTLQSAFDHCLDAIDAQVQRLIASDAQLAAGCRRLVSITGIGPQTASLLAVLFTRFDFANADAVVAYSGLDPRPEESGKRRAPRHLSKRGPPLLRRQLWLAGFAASHSKALKPLYLSLRAKGFASTEAMVILARKLLRVAFAVWKGVEPFDVNRLLPKTA